MTHLPDQKLQKYLMFGSTTIKTSIHLDSIVVGFPLRDYRM